MARILQAEGIAAVAVLFLHSYRAPEHEVRMCEILHETDAIRPPFFATKFPWVQGVQT